MAALMLIDGRVVLARHRSRDSVYHLLPGGGVHYRETIEAALVREVAEETGLRIELGRPLLVSDTIDPVGPRHVVNITFAASITGGEITTHSTDTRVEGVDLVEPDRLAELDLRPPIATHLMRILGDPDAAPAQYLGSLFTPEP